MRRRILAGLFALAFLLPVAPAQAVSTSAGSAILLDATSGRVLYAQNERERRPIASITKLMTALLVAERVADLGALVTVPYEAAHVEGSSMYLATGEQVTVEELLYGLMLPSGNDAAVALAIYTAGDVEHFVARMNTRAAELLMTDTCFDNPNGLNSENHYSTAYDMALLAQACLENEIVADIVATKTIRLGTRTLVNHNKLLWRYEGCTGMKTGYTELAGRTLVSCAQRNGQTLIVVTLRDPNDWKDHAALLDYGFQSYPRFQLARGGKIAYRLGTTGSLVPSVLVATAEDVSYPLLPQEQVTARITLPRRVSAPVELGERLGSMTFYVDGAEIGSTDLLAVKDVYSDAAPERSRVAEILDQLRG